MIPDWKFADARMPTEAERQKLSRLLYLAFVDVRSLILDGQSQQAKDLTDAFHNIPLLMHTNNFNFQAFRDLLGAYQRKHADQSRHNYLQEWEKLTVTSP